MARTFNGTSDYATVPVDLVTVSPAGSRITLSFWLWMNAFSTANTQILLELTANTNTNPGSFFVAPNSSVGFFMSMGDGAGHTEGRFFTQPSSATWHHYLIDVNRGGPTPGTAPHTWTVYVDGVNQGLSVQSTTSANIGPFANSTLYVGSRAGTTLFTACRLAELTLYRGLTSLQQFATMFRAGMAPVNCYTGFLSNPTIPSKYHPLYGDTTEADLARDSFVGNQPLTLNGTGIARHPQVVLPARWASPLGPF